MEKPTHIKINKLGITEIGSRFYYSDAAMKVLHRTDGPAIEQWNGTNEWYYEGRRHRTDGPAMEYADGSKSWYYEGRRHRSDGPAIEFADGSVEWYLEGKQLTEKEFFGGARHA